jgi:hypothetical protein
MGLFKVAYVIDCLVSARARPNREAPSYAVD